MLGGWSFCLKGFHRGRPGCEKVPLTVRNATRHSKFLYDMSNDARLLSALQKLMGCGDLLQWHPFQLEQMMTNVQHTVQPGSTESKQAFKWHNDSNDFVLLVQVGVRKSSMKQVFLNRILPIHTHPILLMLVGISV